MNNNKLAYNILIELEILFSEHYGKNYPIKLTKTDIGYTFCTNNFIITYSDEDKHFYLTFMIGQVGKQISYDTKLIMCILEYQEFTVLEDSYFDKENQQLVFGYEAIDTRQKEILVDQGKTKCPMCDRITPNQYIVESGICKWCDETKSKMIWN